jgi:predicted amino acid racemase
MNRVIIDLHKLKENLHTIKKRMKRHPATWTVVTKVLCGHIDTLRHFSFWGCGPWVTLVLTT